MLIVEDISCRAEPLQSLLQRIFSNVEFYSDTKLLCCTIIKALPELLGVSSFKAVNSLVTEN